MQTSWWTVDNADELPTPTILIYPERVAENLDRMIGWTGDPRKLRPHVKTHKLPQIIQMKRDRGIRKFKASTIAEVEMVAAVGGEDILLAIQQAGANFKRLLRLVERFPNSRISGVVDDLRHLAWMRDQSLARGVRLPLFVDLNIGMNRAGITPGPAARELYEQLVAWSEGPEAAFEVGGLHAYDGHLHDGDEQRLQTLVEKTFEPVWELCRWIGQRGYPLPALVVSGTPTSPILARRTEPHIEVSAGTTVLWDAGQPITCPNMDFLHAAVLLTRVVSRPCEGLVCLDLGHKAVASEFPHPRVDLLGIDDAQAVMHSEEHLVIRTGLWDCLPVGSLVYALSHHICPTMALHSHVWSVRDGVAVERWPVVARDRILRI